MNTSLPHLSEAKPSLRNLHPQIIGDALYCFSKFDPACVRHLRDNVQRLVRGSYSDGRGRGCIFGILSELLPATQRIHDRESLTTYFTGGHGPLFRERECYQPARYLVRVWDGDRDPGTVLRYENWNGTFTAEQVRELADLHLELLEAHDQEEAAPAPAASRASAMVMAATLVD
jgi:hypothetical protein